MTVQLAIATMVGAAIFPFVCRLVWGHFVNEFGTFGGFLAALFIVGVMWALNHGFPLIHQSASLGWVDMGTAAGVGLLVASVARGAKIDKHTKTNLLGALLGAILAGLVLAFVIVK